MKFSIFHICILFVFLFILEEVRAQSFEQTLPTISIGVGYFGELLAHGGMVVYGEYSFNKAQNQFLTRVNIVNYRHKGHTKNLMVLPEIIYRRHTKNLNYWEAAFGLGSLYQKADSQVYEYRQGKFVKKNTGWLYFTPSLGVRYGHTFELNDGNLLTPNLGARVYYQYPFNDFWLLRAAVDFSVSYQIK